ncbi:MAG: hypothetical protein KatS3mg102_2820 [Planctomycetota bacterium]|nr:MAG: hypothetical protein KatS3mg102_2820 [Planctomycetota bacterium]
MQSQRGHTLVELTAAAAVLAIVLVGLLGTFATSLRSDRVEQDRLVATMAARDVMEQLAALPYEDLPAQDGLTFQVLGIQGLADPEIGRITVSDASGGSGELYVVVVEVDDPGGTGRVPFQFRLETRRAKP